MVVHWPVQWPRTAGLLTGSIRQTNSYLRPSFVQIHERAVVFHALEMEGKLPDRGGHPGHGALHLLTHPLQLLWNDLHEWRLAGHLCGAGRRWKILL